MPTTTNYGWTTPADTDLVKDGASAIRTLGTAIDTTTKNLNPETTLGDISYRSSTANTNTRLALGTAGQVLKVNSGATAPEWGTVSSGLTLLTNAAFTTVSSYSLPNSTFSSTYTNYRIIVDLTAISATNILYGRMRSSGSDYTGGQYINQRVYGTSTNALADTTGTTYIYLGNPDTATNYCANIELYKPNVAVKKFGLTNIFGYMNGNYEAMIGGFRVDQSTQYDSFTLIPASGTISGRIFVYGYAI